MNTTLRTLLSQPAFEVAPLLLGCVLEREINGQLVRVKIVETEAYDETDAASHSYKGQTTRTKVMFGEPGHLYVYFTYGMHYCCNIVTGPAGEGSAVLIRAVEPLEGVEVMQAQRNYTSTNLTNGPAKLCQALAINAALNGHNLSQSPLRLIIQPPLDPSRIVCTTRIGIRQAQHTLWRYYIAGNEYVSKP